MGDHIVDPIILGWSDFAAMTIEPAVATEIVDAHPRSLQQGQLTGIASNDEPGRQRIRDLPAKGTIARTCYPSMFCQKKLTQLRQTLSLYAVRSYGVC